jgi:transcriptional regulator GlxA family with amidase domain
MDQRIEMVIRLMKDDQRRAHSLSALAQSVNLSPTRLCCLFKAETGMPPASYLRKLRMNEAAMLLSSTFLSVKEIMVRVGFSDESHFVRDFKRLHGLTPTKYRSHNLVIDPNKIAATKDE